MNPITQLNQRRDYKAALSRMNAYVDNALKMKLACEIESALSRLPDSASFELRRQVIREVCFEFKSGKRLEVVA